MMTAAKRLGLYSALRACSATVFRSNLHPKVTVATMFCSVGTIPDVAEVSFSDSGAALFMSSSLWKVVAGFVPSRFWFSHTCLVFGSNTILFASLNSFKRSSSAIIKKVSLDTPVYVGLEKKNKMQPLLPCFFRRAV
ncbi:hypothetical protein P301_E11776 [Saccharomyces cerevisiae P301]|uniref:Putative uncharacterized membrane protein YER147C-A n=3 Tax=Saccharomyces cerevisiae TaxID=4932 RepID=YE147_YEAST|nr:RecName: Full=Putative uncharacterized membrane protein YER147C-A; Flags: Precursor [Saccharomyces cerevisiae S288C]AHX39284.1 hypothetical protein YER147C-A [Saccharomyces cerevisiae]EDZ72517.1 hypothetical protein AWRI1631_52160 [Saccharomyces cerevisiae AWRI1631]EWG86644.1 hypothetical protein R008_E11796 [Saccharomyces cerevisiae R008]EWG91534.1 hypothetical protein P301_E11776 [Saccharomyces cerevisiae P301]EWG96299.1 hypothetical protein R103_E20241 [Saccharomyces cerevisiae R103]WNV